MGWFVSDQATHIVPRESTMMKTNQEKDPWRLKMIAEGRLEDTTIPSQGHDLPVTWYYTEASQGSRDHNTIILVHGLGSNRHNLQDKAEYFLSLGFNALTYDQRETNENPLDENTYGVLERLDLEAAVQAVRKEAPNRIIGLWGESFGGETVGLGLAMESIDQEVDFAILDCPLSEAKHMILSAIEKMGIPWPKYWYRFASLVTRMRLGFSFDDATVKDFIGSSKTPILVIHSEADEITPGFMGKDIYDAVTHERKSILTFKDAKHCEGFHSHTQEYKQAVETFLDKILN